MTKPDTQFQKAIDEAIGEVDKREINLLNGDMSSFDFDNSEDREFLDKLINDKYNDIKRDQGMTAAGEFLSEIVHEIIETSQDEYFLTWDIDNSSGEIYYYIEKHYV